MKLKALNDDRVFSMKIKSSLCILRAHRKSLGAGELSAAINVIFYLLASGHTTTVGQHLGWTRRGARAVSRQSECGLE